MPSQTPTVLNADPFAPLAPPAAPAAPPPPPALVDAWPDARPFALDGWMERNGFTPAWAGVLVFVLAFIAFQVIGGVAVAGGVGLDAARSGEMPDLSDTAALIASRPHLVLGGNALGQALAFGLVAWFAARLSTRRPAAFLRMRAPDAGSLGLAAVGWAALYPVVLALAQLNALLPLPPWLAGLDEMRGEMLKSLLLGGALSTPFLFLTVALVPAVFEEVLFRGYLQRQAERRFGTRAAIVGVGVAFGLYHLSVAQALPLSVLGVYLCFVVWATGSLWTGVLVHLLNNGLAVAVAGVARNTPGLDPDAVGEMGGPWYVAAGLAAVGAAGVLVVCRMLVARRDAATGGRPDSRPDADPALFSPAPASVAVPS